MLGAVNKQRHKIYGEELSTFFLFRKNFIYVMARLGVDCEGEAIN